MANTFKNIVITPNIGNTADPKIDFLGGNTTANTTINLYVYPDANGTLSFEGSAGQLFSITNDLANLLFSVSDVSGIPSLEVYANGLVSIAPLGGNVVLGVANAGIVANSTGITTSTNTTVNSNLTAALLRIANSTGSANLTATSLVIGATTIQTTNAILGGTVAANGGIGTAGQVLKSGGAGANAYWAADLNSGGTVTSVGSGNGLTGGPITGTGTLSVVAGTDGGLVSNATGVWVLAGNGLITNSTGVHVGAGNGISLAADAISVNSGSTLTINTTGAHVNSALSITSLTTTGNVTVGASVSANGGVGSAGQVLKSGGSGANAYWAADLNSGGTVTSVATGTGLTGGPVTSTGTISLATAGAGAASYSSGISALSVDAYGRVTSVTGSANYVTSSGVTSVASANGIAGGTITGTGTLYAVAGNSTLFVNATGIHVNTASLAFGTGTVTSVATGNGLTGGAITTTGTVSVVANTGIVANATGVHLATAGAGAASYASGISALSVDAYGRVTSVTGSANYVTSSGVTSVASANGISGGTITGTGTLYAVAGNSTLFVNATGIHVNTAALAFGTGTVTSVGSGNGLTGGAITGSGTLSVVAGTDGGLVSNATGVWVLAGNGLITNSTGVHVGAGNGITLAADSIAVTAGSGVVVNATGVHVSASIDNITDEHRIFNNMGDNHATRTAFDATNPSYNFGWRFVQGATNGPGTGSQYYSEYVGLGNDYAATGAGSYGMQIAIPRNTTTPYISVRYNENNTFAGWQKISAGYADTAGTANNSTYAFGKTEGNLNVNTAATATNLTSTRSNWTGTGVISAVVGQLAWKNYNNNHTIFDASAGTSPDGGAVNNTDATNGWIATYPTLMGWNGSATYGVRVDNARVANSATNSAQLGGVVAASYQLNSTLSANVATMTANNSTNLGGVAAASYQLNSTLSANVATMTANNSTNLGGVAAANYARASRAFAMSILF